ncbi:MAG: hypothetical protein ABSD62_14430 [Candidatus Limnocylindrales bacterium]|jgi:hypothetical protein
MNEPPDPRPRRHFDRIVLVCGAVGLLIGLGFIVVGFVRGPSTYELVGVAALFLVAISVLLAPFLAPHTGRNLALRGAFVLLIVAAFFAAWGPVTSWLAQYWTDVIRQSIPTPSAAAQWIAH